MAGKLLDETGLAELWSLIKAKDADITAIANAKAKAEVVSYVGTGTNGSSNPCSVTFSFAPKIIIMLCSIETHKNGVNRSLYFGVADTSYRKTVMFSDVLTTDWLGVGFSNNGSTGYGKKSSDGKTIYWYHNDGKEYQFNNAATAGYTVTYYVMGIG